MDNIHWHLMKDKPLKEFGVVCERFTNRVETNVPCLVVQHSPTGYEWGYGGSGPADLALNILENVLKETEHKGERTQCFQGDCFYLAYVLHMPFKWQFIAPMRKSGGTIPFEYIREWLLWKAAQIGVCPYCGADETGDVFATVHNINQGVYGCKSCGAEWYAEDK